MRTISCTSEGIDRARPIIEVGFGVPVKVGAISRVGIGVGLG